MSCRTQVENPAIRQTEERRRILNFRGIDPNREPPCYIAPTIRRHLPENTWIWDKALFNVPTCECGLNCEKPGPGDLKWPLLHTFACKTPKVALTCRQPEPCNCEKCYRITVKEFTRTESVGKSIAFAFAVIVAIIILFLLVRRR